MPLDTYLLGVLFWDNCEAGSLECWPQSFILDWDRGRDNKHWWRTVRCTSIQSRHSRWLLWQNILIFGDKSHAGRFLNKPKEAIGSQGLEFPVDCWEIIQTWLRWDFVAMCPAPWITRDFRGRPCESFWWRLRRMRYCDKGASRRALVAHFT